jgi:glutaminase
VGFTEHDEMYSKMIREGQITREQALQRCSLDHKPRIPSLMVILTELGVAKDELDEVLSKYRKSLLPKILKDH